MKKLQVDEIAKQKKDLATKGKTILQVNKDMAAVQAQNEALLQMERQLKCKLNVLQQVAGDVVEDKEEYNIVVSHEVSEVSVDADAVSKLTKKVETLSKKNSVLQDNLNEVRTKFEKVDNFYQTIIEQKDKTIETCLEITSENFEDIE